MRRIALEPALLAALICGVAPVSDVRAADASTRELISANDLRSAPVPDQENAVWYLKQAADALNWTGAGDLDRYGPGWRPSAEWQREAAAVMQANSRSLDLAREARKHTAVDWSIHFEVVNGVNAPVLPPLAKFSRLQRLLTAAILHHHVRGDDAAALDAAQDALFASRLVGECPLLVAHLASSIRMAATDNAIQMLATTLAVQDAANPSNSAATRPASREAVKRLITVLLEEDVLRQQHRRAFESERMVHLMNAPGQMDARSREALDYYLQIMEEAIEAGRQPRLTPMEPPEGEDPAQLVKSIEPTRRMLFETLLIHRMAAVALAANFYCNDTGEYPTSLAELVPAYLPVVPSDPLAQVDRPLGYLLAANGDRPVLWSVGRDGVPGQWDETALGKQTAYVPTTIPARGIDDCFVDLSERR